MNKSLGKNCTNTVLTHGAIRCVCGERKCTFRTTTVTHILRNNVSLIFFCYCGNISNIFKKILNVTFYRLFYFSFDVYGRVI